MKNEGSTIFDKLNKEMARLDISYTINAQYYINNIEQGNAHLPKHVKRSLYY